MFAKVPAQGGPEGQHWTSGFWVMAACGCPQHTLTGQLQLQAANSRSQGVGVAEVGWQQRW
jgi:hypothetical protein